MTVQPVALSAMNTGRVVMGAGASANVSVGAGAGATAGNGGTKSGAVSLSSWGGDMLFYFGVMLSVCVWTMGMLL